MDKKVKLEARLENQRNNIIIVKEGEVSIGHLSMVLDEQHGIFDGILVLHKYLEREDIFRIGQLIQNEFVDLDEEMFIETYFGINFGMLCDETPSNWYRMIKNI